MQQLVKEFTKGLWTELPPFRLVLGLCPTLAVTKTADNGLGMGLAVIFVLVLSNMLISLVRDIIPKKVRIVCFIAISASLVVAVELLMQAYAYPLYQQLGIFVPLIVVNCIILGRAEAFSYKNGMVASFFDGIFQGIGYTWVLLAMCIIREFLGGGTFGGGVLGAVNEAGQHVGIQIFPADYGIGMLTLPVGGFLVLAALIAAMQWALARPKKDKEESK